MPIQLFYTTGIPVCLWFLTKDSPPTLEERTLAARSKGEVLSLTPGKWAKWRLAQSGSYLMRRLRGR
jgi:hypothetical protein